MSQKLCIVYGIGCGHCDRFKKNDRAVLLNALKSNNLSYREFDVDMRQGKTGVKAIDQKLKQFPSFFVYDDATQSVIGEIDSMDPTTIVNKMKIMTRPATPVTQGGFPVTNSRQYRF